MLRGSILKFDRVITAWHRSDETSQRLDESPGLGPALTNALIASLADPRPSWPDGKILTERR